MRPLEPLEFVLLYAGLTLMALFLFLRVRPRRGMRLRFEALRGRASAKVSGTKSSETIPTASAPSSAAKSTSEPRVLNVVFNYNGHSWDAFEVLGLPAGCSWEKVDSAFQEAMKHVDSGSRPFIEAAYQAIQQQFEGAKAANQ